MTALPKAKTVDAIIGTTTDVKYMAEPLVTKAANANDPAALPLFARFVAFMDAWTQSSYDSWAKQNDLPHHPWD
jgi:hypothetical protein